MQLATFEINVANGNMDLKKTFDKLEIPNLARQPNPPPTNTAKTFNISLNFAFE